jgi:hypothetical protein
MSSITRIRGGANAGAYSETGEFLGKRHRTGSFLPKCDQARGSIIASLSFRLIWIQKALSFTKFLKYLLRDHMHIGPSSEQVCQELQLCLYQIFEVLTAHRTMIKRAGLSRVAIARVDMIHVQKQRVQRSVIRMQ